MKDKLEHLIWEKREFIQNDEPPEGHFDRFEGRLEKMRQRNRKFNYRQIWRIAAVVAFAVLITNQIVILTKKHKAEKFSLGSVSKQYREVEFYYTSAINAGMLEWNKMAQKGYLSEQEISGMKKEQKEFDQQYQSLVKELKTNPDDERVINAMLEYYQTRLNIINLIINDLKHAKQQKYENNETTL